MASFDRAGQGRAEQGGPSSGDLLTLKGFRKYEIDFPRNSCYPFQKGSGTRAGKKTQCICGEVSVTAGTHYNQKKNTRVEGVGNNWLLIGGESSNTGASGAQGRLDLEPQCQQDAAAEEPSALAPGCAQAVALSALEGAYYQQCHHLRQAKC